MKAEEFFKLVLEQVFCVDEIQIKKHFKNFKKRFKHLPNTKNSLNEDIKGKNGSALNTDQVNQYIKELKNNYQINRAEFNNHFLLMQNMRLNLFLQEINQQLDYAKQSFNDYQTLKNNEPLDSEKIFKVIHHFSIHSANVSKLLDKINSDIQKTQLLTSKTDKLDLDLEQIKRLRNHLEHFDERLEAWFHMNWGNPIFDMNIFNESTKGMPDGKFLRVLNIEKDIFYILDEKYELNLLFELIITLKKTLKKMIF